jgi:glucosamine--fructose-6-phosphate aminotransferase (isomerizing)
VGGAEGTRMQAEIAESPARIAAQLAANRAGVRALAADLRRSPPRFVATGARGSSDNAATYARYLLETRLGLATLSAAPSVASVYAATPDLGGALFIAISQSGRSPDLVAQAEAARRAGARVLALVNFEDSPLAAVADAVLPLHAGAELSVAATKSFLCSLSAIAQLVAEWSGDDRLRAALEALPCALAQDACARADALVDGLAAARNLFVVARGTGLAAAQEIALKLKETCGLHAEAFSAAEVQHGPMTLVEAGFPVLFLVQGDDTCAGTLEVAARFRARGASVWIVGDPAGDGALRLPATADPACTPILAVHRCYAAILALALRRGRDPDRPPHLAKVTRTR